MKIRQEAKLGKANDQLEILKYEETVIYEEGLLRACMKR